MKRFIFLFVLIMIGSCLAQVSPSNHVFIVLEENHGYTDVNSSSMPYLTSLASQYGLATNYYASTHPSIGNYFMLTTGQIITNDDGYSSTVSADNIARHMLAAGKTFKQYSESIPYAGYSGGDAYPYVQHHNPLSYFSDVRNSSIASSVLVPFTELANDIAASQLPNFGFIVPNNLNNGHDGSLASADNWLKNQIAPLIASPQFQQDGILVIVFDEAASSDSANGGGHVFLAVIGPRVNKGLRSTVFHQHQSTLRMMMTALGMASFPGAAQSAPDMGEFFVAAQPEPPPSPTSMTISPASASVTAGGAATYQVGLTENGGTAGNASLACVGLPPGVSCSFNPPVVNLGTSQVATTLIVSTTAAKAGLLHPHNFRFALLVPVLGLVGIVGAVKRRTLGIAAVLCAFMLGAVLLGCGGASTSPQPATTSGPTPAGSYTVTVTATSGSVETSATARLIVQ